MVKLFSNIKIKNLDLKNRIVMAPMCMNSSDDTGHATKWHKLHYGTRAIGGSELIIVEATGVENIGRIEDRDLGLWQDSHIAPLKEIVDICHEYGRKVIIQLGHAGRKSRVLEDDSIAPSPIPFDDSYRTPREMTKEDILRVTEAFKKAAERALKAGFDGIEIHSAHGYLINQFLSPLTNKRTDEYGCSLENRGRFMVEIIRAVKEAWPEDKVLAIRFSAEEYAQGGNHIEEMVLFAQMAEGEGVDLIDVSSGAVVNVPIDAYPGYQVSYAEAIKKATSVPVIAGGLITLPAMAEEILKNNRADLVFLGRELLREPYWPLRAAHELKYPIEYPHQYLRGKYR